MNRPLALVAMSLCIWAFGLASVASADGVRVRVGHPITKTFANPKPVNFRAKITGDTPVLISFYDENNVWFFGDHFFPGQVCDLQSTIRVKKVEMTADNTPGATEAVVCKDKRVLNTPLRVSLGLTAVCSGGVNIYYQIKSCPVTGSPRFRVKNMAGCTIEVVRWLATGPECAGFVEGMKNTLAPGEESPALADSVRAWEVRWLGGVANDDFVELTWLD